MSVRVMSLVWDSTVQAPERFTLLALADRADEDGFCWPSVPTLAKKCRTGESTVRRHLKALQVMGVLCVKHRVNDSSEYRIQLARLREMVDPIAEQTSQSGSTPQSEWSSQSGRSSQIDSPPNLTGQTSQSDQSRPPNLSTETSQSERLSIIDPSVDTSVIHQGVRASAPNARGVRLPDDFTVTPEMVAWARANVPHIDGRRETAKFLDHWRAASGASARKRDWVAAWRNWMRKSDEQRPAVRTLTALGRTPTTTQRVGDALALLRPEEDR